jgi:hypothetical protein
MPHRGDSLFEGGIGHEAHDTAANLTLASVNQLCD